MLMTEIGKLIKFHKVKLIFFVKKFALVLKIFPVIDTIVQLDQYDGLGFAIV